jgi:hypothetical protein
MAEREGFWQETNNASVFSILTCFVFKHLIQPFDTVRRNATTVELTLSHVRLSRQPVDRCELSAADGSTFHQPGRPFLGPLEDGQVYRMQGRYTPKRSRSPKPHSMRTAGELLDAF